MRLILRWLFDLLLRFMRTLDLPLLGALLALMGIGLAVLYSAGDPSSQLVIAQGARFAVGLGFMWLLSRMPPSQLRNWTPVGCMGFRCCRWWRVLFLGTESTGRHWINLACSIPAGRAAEAEPADDGGLVSQRRSLPPSSAWC
jgi:rod shape determining protein RodA